MSEEKSVEALRAELEIEKAKLKALQDQVNPPPRQPSTWQPIDRTAGMSMPANAMKAMVDALPSSFFSDLRGDARRPNPVTEASSSTVTGTPSAQSQPTQRGSGWRNEVPLGPQPGIAHVDRLAVAQDKIDRAELVERLAKAAMIEQAAKGAGDDNK
jgi:hypothetical protein